ncbi:M23 family metallopeptidase [Alistipes finegoldii]|jgi:peptidase M23B|uniref:M23 family metallopeptidase n=1 Tax=Alistipes finegoldii TaxID=214856 RepID=UPI001C37C5C2|nr:M23 family metallopeptidase [Alistipes finegoldii]MBV4325898.1 M23 family metallopeptidase [Alistipes finegoldii]MBV4350042.1 M23 family metallopeptidase [Alistipes finegoldii]MBV4371098.1 M23 family metallopeptidase [Alistipes finegoldii]
MNWTTLSALVLFMGLTQSGQYKIERLLSIATNYSQVEKTIMLLKYPNTIITSVPCISPLQAEDLRRIPVSSRYGQRLHPILHEYKHHSGIDLPGQMSERVHSTANGLVIATGENRNIGKYVKIKHNFGFITLYGHLSKIKVCKADSIHIGQVIGLVGSTGRSTGPHLHYGITKNGKEQNPLPYCYLYLHWQNVLIREGKK